MKKLLLVLFCALLMAAPVWAAKIDQSSLTNWAKSASVAGYAFGGVEETDPGVYMAVWMNKKEEMIGIQLQPAAEFSKMANQTINKKKPASFIYNGAPAIYTDALAPSASLAISYEKAGKTLVLMNMGQARAFTQAELVKILDGMNVDKLFK